MSFVSQQKHDKVMGGPQGAGMSWRWKKQNGEKDTFRPKAESKQI